MNNSSVSFTLSGEVYLKSKRTQRRFVSLLRRNLAAATGVDVSALRRTQGNRIVFEGPLGSSDLEAGARVFGVSLVEVGVEVPSGDLAEIAARVVEVWGERAAEGTYAVRVRRRGEQAWNSQQAERVIGAALDHPRNRVDLENPDHLISVRVDDKNTFIATERLEGPGGLPLGSQEPVLCLISGGFDSVVAAWMLMSRGCPVHFVHFGLDCAQADHAIAVAETLVDLWGHGTDPLVYLVDFQPVKDALRSEVEPRMRQIALKSLMATAASELAVSEGVAAIATGDSLGQVSSQTLTHLSAIDAAATVPILRPLVGMDKQAIIDLARVVGTQALSARAKEVCDLSEGRPVAVGARPAKVAEAAQRIDHPVLAKAVAEAHRFRISEWTPGAFPIGDAA
ncbi:MAG: tRNA sulfurtransferase [Acidimicrobiia bacterium]